MRWSLPLLLMVTGCSHTGQPQGLAANQVEALGLDQPQSDPRVQALVDDAQDWYVLYQQSADPALWRRHATAAEGAAQLRAAAPVPPAPMPSSLDDDDLLMPYGRG